MESRVDVPRKSNKRKNRWSDREDRYISTHRRDGYILISEGLSVFGRHRSPDAVKMHAKRALSLNLSKYPASGVRKCIECGRWETRPETQAGRAGFCIACWQRRKAEAYAEATDELRARREYDQQKKFRKTLNKKGHL